MASQPLYAVQYQTYHVPGRNGQPPLAIAKPHWVKIPQSHPPQVVPLGLVPCQQLPHQTPICISLPPPQAGYATSPGPMSYYRLNPAGEWATFTSPWHNPTVGRKHWDPEKPMPLEDWLVRQNIAPF